eukprot:m.1228506 g.1228506  ORF g.1228506 m.1228506 type:complete len:52 (-) comp24644_c1_seq5:80-235(-)
MSAGVVNGMVLSTIGRFAAQVRTLSHPIFQRCIKLGNMYIGSTAGSDETHE